jgi:site-specific recombinase XerD
VPTALLQTDQLTIADASRLLLDKIQNSSTRAMYGKALSDFLAWCQAQAASPLTRTIVEQHKSFLLSQGYSAATVNQRLTAIRQYARHAADKGLLAREDAAEILAIRGSKKETILSDGKSLDFQEAESLLNAPNPDTRKGKRDRALLALLLGCGLRRNEIVQTRAEDIRPVEGRWVLSQVIGRHGTVRMVPLPSWVKLALDCWLEASNIQSGVIFRALDREGTLLGRGLSAQMVLATVAGYGKNIGVSIAPRDLRRTCARLCRDSGADLEQIQLLLGRANIQATGAYLGVTQNLTEAPNDALRLRWRRTRKRAR